MLNFVLALFGRERLWKYLAVNDWEKAGKPEYSISYKGKDYWFRISDSFEGLGKPLCSK